MYIVIQNIHMSWSNKYHISELISKYNVPESREVDTDCFDVKSGRFYVQDICFDEWNNFKEYTYTRSGDINKGVHLNCLKLKIEDDSLRVYYEHRPELVGEPVREHSACPMDLFSLGKGGWGKVKFNGRITCMDSGSLLCHQQIFNIALLDNQKKTFDCSASNTYEDMADLCL